VSPDTEPEDDAETEAMQLPPEAEGAAIAQTAAPTGARDLLSSLFYAHLPAAMRRCPCGPAMVQAVCRLAVACNPVASDTNSTWHYALGRGLEPSVHIPQVAATRRGATAAIRCSRC